MQRLKGQGMFEYILLLAGILLIVVLAVVVLRGGIFQGAQKDTQTSACQAGLSRLSACYYTNGTWAPSGISVTVPACAGLTVGGVTFDAAGSTANGCGTKPA